MDTNNQKFIEEGKFRALNDKFKRNPINRQKSFEKIVERMNVESESGPFIRKLFPVLQYSLLTLLAVGVLFVAINPEILLPKQDGNKTISYTSEDITIEENNRSHVNYYLDQNIYGIEEIIEDYNYDLFLPSPSHLPDDYKVSGFYKVPRQTTEEDDFTVMMILSNGPTNNIIIEFIPCSLALYCDELYEYENGERITIQGISVIDNSRHENGRNVVSLALILDNQEISIYSSHLDDKELSMNLMNGIIENYHSNK